MEENPLNMEENPYNMDKPHEVEEGIIVEDLDALIEERDAQLEHDIQTKSDTLDNLVLGEQPFTPEKSNDGLEHTDSDDTNEINVVLTVDARNLEAKIDELLEKAFINESYDDDEEACEALNDGSIVIEDPPETPEPSESKVNPDPRDYSYWANFGKFPYEEVDVTDSDWEHHYIRYMKAGVFGIRGTLEDGQQLWIQRDGSDKIKLASNKSLGSLSIFDTDPDEENTDLAYYSRVHVIGLEEQVVKQLNEIDRLYEKIDNLQKDNEYLLEYRKDFDDLLESYENLEENYENLDKDYDDFLENYKNFEENYKILDKEYDDLLENYENLEKEIKDLKIDYDNLNKTNRSLREDIEILNEDLDDAHTQIRQDTKEIDKLYEANTQLARNRNGLMKANLDLKEQNNSLSDELATCKAELASLKINEVTSS